VQENPFHTLGTQQNPWPPVANLDTRAGYARRYGLTGKTLDEFRQNIAFAADLLHQPDVISETGHRNGVKAIAFSPNGKWLAFVSGRFGNPHIFRAELDWNKERTSVKVAGDKRLTYAGWYNATPAWSPDSEKIAFGGYDKDIDRWDLFMMNPDGTKLERLTLQTGDSESPSWSPNGQLIVFQSNRIGIRNVKGPSPALYIMNRDGSGQRKLQTGLYEAQTPKWSPVLSD
jgi:dipeptidyl aminopeptidase/acylaminoacyl peptidase